jgi:hypothetical protein
LYRGYLGGKEHGCGLGHHRLTNQIYTFFTYENDGLSEKKLEKLYVNEIVRLYGVPMLIVSNQDPKFTSRL